LLHQSCGTQRAAGGPESASGEAECSGPQGAGGHGRSGRRASPVTKKAPCSARPSAAPAGLRPRRAADLGMKVKIGCHTFRATGITAYLEAGGTLENAQAMAAHEGSEMSFARERRKPPRCDSSRFLSKRGGTGSAGARRPRRGGTIAILSTVEARNRHASRRGRQLAGRVTTTRRPSDLPGPAFDRPPSGRYSAPPLPRRQRAWPRRSDSL
jgi:hypothetical protein